MSAVELSPEHYAGLARELAERLACEAMETGEWLDDRNARLVAMEELCFGCGSDIDADGDDPRVVAFVEMFAATYAALRPVR